VAEKKTKVKEALATEEGVLGNENLGEVKASIIRTVNVENVRPQDTVALFFNDRMVYWKKDGKIKILYRGGIYLSAEEWKLRENVLKKEGKLQKQMEQYREDNGLKLRWKEPKRRPSEILARESE